MSEPTAQQEVKQKVKTMGLSFGERMKVAKAKSQKASSHKDLDIAILKATSSRFQVVPKEKHVTTLKLTISSGGSRMVTDYIISGLLKRLHTATDWLTALKTLITFHRLLRETDVSFLEEVLKVGEGQAKGRGARVFAMENFLDLANMEGRFDYSEWVRAYGNYLDEQLELFSIMHFHLDQEGGGDKPSRLRTLDAKDLLYQLPQVQRLQRRLVDCVPRGLAAHDPVVLFSLTLVLRESFKVYRTVSEGVINLADKFFELEYLNAVKGLELYRESIDATESLTRYYNSLEQLEEIKRSVQLPSLTCPPADIISSMEAYIADAPRPVPLSAEGDTPIAARRNMPLRKGRYTSASPSGAGTSGLSLDVSTLLPMTSGADQALAALAEDTAAAEEDQQQQPAVQEDLAEEEETPAEPAMLPEFDLLGFGDDVQQPIAPAVPSDSEAAAAAEKEKRKPTPLELLSELDFGFNDLGPPTDTSTMSPTAFHGNGSSTAAPGGMSGSGYGGPLPPDSRGSAASGYSGFSSSNGSSLPVTPSPTPVIGAGGEGLYEQSQGQVGFGGFGGGGSQFSQFSSEPQQQQQQFGSGAPGGPPVNPYLQYSGSNQGMVSGMGYGSQTGQVVQQQQHQQQMFMQQYPQQQAFQYQQPQLAYYPGGASQGLKPQDPLHHPQMSVSPNKTPSPAMHATGSSGNLGGPSLRTSTGSLSGGAARGPPPGPTQELFKAAGAHDPFSALSGLPRK